MFLNSSPARSCKSSFESIWPLPSVSNIWKAVLRYDSRVKVCASIVAAKNSNLLQVKAAVSYPYAKRAGKLTRVVDCATVVGICGLQKLQKLFTILTVSKAALKLLERDGTISIFIERLEHFFELLDVIRIRLNCDSHQSNLLDFLRLVEVFDVA